MLCGDLKQQVGIRLVPLTCFCRAFRKALSMNFLKRLYSQLKHRRITGMRAVCRALPRKPHSPLPRTGSSTAGFLLPGSTVEFDAHATDGGRAVDSADLRTACPVSLDGDARSDGEITDAQIERAAVLSVKREASPMQQKYHRKWI